MRRLLKKLLSPVGQALHFIGSNIWLLAVLGPPIVLLTGRYELLVFIFLLILIWELTKRFTGFLIRRSGSESWQVPDQHLTYAGYMYVLLALALCAISINTGLNLLYLVACLLPALLLSSMVISSFVMTRLRARWDLPDYIFADEEFEADLLVRNNKKWVASPAITVDISPLNQSDDDQPEISAGYLPPERTKPLPFRHAFPARGYDSIPALHACTTFPFGLMKASATVVEETEVLVFPALGRIRKSSLVQKGGPGGKHEQQISRRASIGDFRSLREYREDDSYSHIHWRTSARLGELYVKEFEHPQQEHYLLLLDAYLPEAESRKEEKQNRRRFEKAVSFTATLAKRFLDEGAFFAFASCCPDKVQLPWGAGPAHFFNLMELLALAKRSDRTSLQDLSRSLGPSYLGKGTIYTITLGAAEPTAGARELSTPPERTVSINTTSRAFDEIFTLER